MRAFTENAVEIQMLPGGSGFSQVRNYKMAMIESFLGEMLEDLLKGVSGRIFNGSA